jgi:hypothetical protein
MTACEAAFHSSCAASSSANCEALTVFVANLLIATASASLTYRLPAVLRASVSFNKRVSCGSMERQRAGVSEVAFWTILGHGRD